MTHVARVSQVTAKQARILILLSVHILALLAWKTYRVASDTEPSAWNGVECSSRILFRHPHWALGVPGRSSH